MTRSTIYTNEAGEFIDIPDQPVVYRCHTDPIYDDLEDDKGDPETGWMDKARARQHQALAIVKHDSKHAYNPPAVFAPAISQAQFEYDEQRDMEVALLANPTHLAFKMQEEQAEKQRLVERIERLERLLNEKENDHEQRTIIDP